MIIASGGLGGAPSSAAGVIGAIAGGITALTALITVITLLVPQLRAMRKSAAQQAQQLTEQTAQLRVIHRLVNSTLSASMQAELDATRREVAVMTEIVDMRERGGLMVTAATTAALDRAGRRIRELTLEIQDRQQQAQDILDAAELAQNQRG